MFGAASSGGSGLFGSTQNKPGFGNAAPAQLSGFQFGQSTTSNTNPTSSGSGFSFGSNSNSGGLFGSNSTAQSGLGAPATSQGTTGLGSTGNTAFGGASNTQQGGLFGSAANNNTSAAPPAGGLFGKPAAPTGGLFGGSTGQTNQGGLFGNTSTQNTTNAQTGQTGGLFGKPATAAPSGGLFGASTNTAAAAQPQSGLFGSKPATGGLFGSSTANPPSLSLGGTNNAASGGLFGNNAAKPPAAGPTALGGAPSNTAGTGGLFGNNTNNAQPSFAWSSQQNTNVPANLLNLQLSQAPAKAQQNSSTYTPAINDQLIKLKEQWDPNSPKCVLKTHLYNKFSEEEMEVLMRQPRPANETPEDWDNAMSNRPGPLYYPVKVTSFSEVAQRIEVQLDHVAKGRVLLNNINDELTQLLSKHDLDNTTRIMKAKVRHTKLARRLLRLATILAVLKLKGYPLLPEEEEISKQFQALNAKITDPNAPVGKLSDLYARLAILKGRSEELSSQLDSSIQNMNGGLKSVTNDSRDVSGEGKTQLDQIINLLTKLLYKQQVGLSYLNDVLQKDLTAVNEATAKR